MDTNNSLIPVYFIEDLSVADMDRLIERGEIFDVRSKASVLSRRDTTSKEYSFWERCGGGGVFVSPETTQR